MAVRKFYSTKAKAGWRFDARQSKFWSYGFDIYLESGKRKRKSGFATKQSAENAVARIKIGEKEKTYKLQTRKFPLVSEVLEKRLMRIGSDKEKAEAQQFPFSETSSPNKRKRRAKKLASNFVWTRFKFLFP